MTTYSALQERLRFSFQSVGLLDQALTHKSFKNENRSQPAADNERLELLGDAVLSLCLVNLLLAAHPEESEGFLSRKRASLVNEETLCEIAQELELPPLLKLGKGEQISGGSGKPRLLASALEAVLGAIFIDTGYAKVEAIVHLLFETRMTSEQLNLDFEKDYKTRLQEWSQGSLGLTPQYQVAQAEGPDHQRTFSVEVLISGEVRGAGQGKTKKQAEQEAAKKLLTEVLSV